MHVEPSKKARIDSFHLFPNLTYLWSTKCWFSVPGGWLHVDPYVQSLLTYLHHYSLGPYKAGSPEFLDKAHWGQAGLWAFSASSACPFHMWKSYRLTRETNSNRCRFREYHLKTMTNIYIYIGQYACVNAYIYMWYKEHYPVEIYIHLYIICTDILSTCVNMWLNHKLGFDLLLSLHALCLLCFSQLFS